MISLISLHSTITSLCLPIFLSFHLILSLLLISSPLFIVFHFSASLVPTFHCIYPSPHSFRCLPFPLLIFFPSLHLSEFSLVTCRPPVQPLLTKLLQVNSLRWPSTFKSHCAFTSPLRNTNYNSFAQHCLATLQNTLDKLFCALSFSYSPSVCNVFTRTLRLQIGRHLSSYI